jgi:hypothetical protein
LYCCDGGACATERLRAGEAPELLLFEVPGSAHAGRFGLHSVSESATREPEPVLPSARSKLLVSRRVSVAGGLAGSAVCVPLGRELSLRAEPNAKFSDEALELVLFHMLTPQGLTGRSESLLLSAMPPRLLMLRARTPVWRN